MIDIKELIERIESLEETKARLQLLRQKLKARVKYIIDEINEVTAIVESIHLDLIKEKNNKKL